jgi:hypothetical protein
VTAVCYRNPLAGPDDLKDLRAEGDVALSTPLGRLRLESRRPAAEGQRANFVLWFPCLLPAEFAAEWLFWPVAEPGLAMVFFGAQRRGGGDVLGADAAPRTGEYDQYRYGDMDTYHLSYFRRGSPDERRFHTVNLRRSHGFHLLGQGADPIPEVASAGPPYRLRLAREDGRVRFSVDGLPVLDTHDAADGVPALTGDGRLGFRQMAPMIGEYSDLVVTSPAG